MTAVEIANDDEVLVINEAIDKINIKNVSPWRSVDGDDLKGDGAVVTFGF